MKNCYANLTILLADVHIDSGYLVVVTKEGSVENESENRIFNRWRGTCAIPIYQVLLCLVIATIRLL